MWYFLANEFFKVNIKTVVLTRYSFACSNSTVRADVETSETHLKKRETEKNISKGTKILKYVQQQSLLCKINISSMC